MMLADWQIFWFQHNLRPQLTESELKTFEFDIAIDTIRIAMNKVARSLSEAVAPAMKRFAEGLSQFILLPDA